MPRKTKEGMLPYEEIDQKEYHRQYYKKNKELIKSKRLMAKELIEIEDVKKWKEEKLKDPWGHYPFHDYSKPAVCVEEPDTSNPDTSTTGSPSSSPT